MEGFAARVNFLAVPAPRPLALVAPAASAMRFR
jgi:hypothetical protein